jgi:hypothetical protein
MSALGLRGHQPRTVRYSAVAAPASADAARVHRSAPQPTSVLQIRNEQPSGGNSIRVYWLEEDYTADENYFILAAASEYEGPAEVKEFWVRGDGGPADLTAIFYLRRG